MVPGKIACPVGAGRKKRAKYLHFVGLSSLLLFKKLVKIQKNYALFIYGDGIRHAF